MQTNQIEKHDRKLRTAALTKLGLAVVAIALAAVFSGKTRAADLYADAGATANGDGTAGRPYWRITEAIARARNLRQSAVIPVSERIVIHVAPGAYLGSKENPVLNQNPRYEALPLVLNVPNLTLAGSTILISDDRGLPSGIVPATETLLKTVDHFGSWLGESVILIARTTDGGVGDNVTVSGLHLDQPDEYHLSANIFIDRVSGFRIEGNVSTHGFGAALAQQASGTAEGNLVFDDPGPGVGFFSGGRASAPASLAITRNRVRRSEGGLMLCAVAGSVQPHVGANNLEIVSQQTTFDPSDPPVMMLATVVNNDFSQNHDFGMRLVCLPGNSNGGGAVRYPSKDAAHGVMLATVTGNTANANGLYGITVDSAFALRENKRPDSFAFSGTFRGNQAIGNGQAGFLFAFTAIWVEENNAPLDKNNGSLQFFKYLQNSRYDVTVLDDEAAGFDYDNPVADPLDGTVLNNTLIVNGAVIPAGRKITAPTR